MLLAAIKCANGPFNYWKCTKLCVEGSPPKYVEERLAWWIRRGTKTLLLKLLYYNVLNFRTFPLILIIYQLQSSFFYAKIVDMFGLADRGNFCFSSCCLIQRVKHTYMFDNDKWKTTNKSWMIKLQTQL